MATTKKEIKIGLALGGGSAKGFAHIGVLKTLKKHKIKVDMISGTSIGSVIGALYLSNKENVNKIEELSKEFKFRRNLDFSLRKKVGLLAGNKLERYFKKEMGFKKIEDLPKPLYITATNMKDNELVVFNKGNLAKAVRASIAIPGIFEPIILNNRVLYDGGIRDSVPADILKAKGANLVIGVDLANIPNKKKRVLELREFNEQNKKPKLKQTIFQFMEIISDLTTDESKIDVVIKPKLKNEDLLAFNEAERLIKLGEEATEEKIGEIKRMISAFEG